MADTTSDTAESAVDSNENACGHDSSIGRMIFGARFDMGDEVGTKVGSLPELQYRVLSTLRSYLSDSDVKSGYYGTRYTFKLRNGQTAVVTIDVSDEDKK